MQRINEARSEISLWCHFNSKALRHVHFVVGYIGSEKVPTQKQESPLEIDHSAGRVPPLSFSGIRDQEAILRSFAVSDVDPSDPEA